MNGLWSVIFFGQRSPGLALAEIIVLWVLILVTTIQFFRLDTTSGWLMMPYLGWVSFASVLNATVWGMNR